MRTRKTSENLNYLKKWFPVRSCSSPTYAWRMHCVRMTEAWPHFYIFMYFGTAH